MTQTFDMSAALQEMGGCKEWNRLLRRFIAAAGYVIAIQCQGQDAIPFAADGDSVDQVFHRAVVEKVRAKGALLCHLEGHRGCGAAEWETA